MNLTSCLSWFASMEHRSEKEGMKMLSGKQLVVLLTLMLLLPFRFTAANSAAADQGQEIRRIIEI